MLIRVLHRLVAQPRVYDTVQWLAGAAEVQRRVTRQIRRLPPAVRVLDLGGGTGIARGLWPAGCTYICLDPDPQKLRGFLSKHPGGAVLQADGARIPLAGNSLDVILCKGVSHHLPDAVWQGLLDESRRVLKPGGIFLFVDAVWAPRRAAGRLLWRLDRGAHPRAPRLLHAAIARRYGIRQWERFAIYHAYVICVARKGAAGGPA